MKHCQDCKHYQPHQTWHPKGLCANPGLPRRNVFLVVSPQHVCTRWEKGVNTLARSSEQPS